MPVKEHEEPQFDPAIQGGIVVGHDGSKVSSGALAWAVEEARLRRLPLHVVRAWRLSTAIAETKAPFGSVPSFQECATAVAAALDRALSAVDCDGAQVHRHVVHGSAPRTLLSAARSADMLVVGDLGSGGFVGLTVGSSAEQVVRHAACTVVVVRSRPS